MDHDVVRGARRRPGAARLRLLLVGLGLLGTGGCAREVVLESLPSGATVRINDEVIGTTPIKTELATSSWWGLNRTVTVSHPGFRTVQGELDWEWDPLHLLALGGLVFWPSQAVHLHPRLHRRPKASYLVVLDEDPDGSAGPETRRLYGAPSIQE